MSAYLAGMLPGLLILAIYQAWAFGSFFRPSQHYMPDIAATTFGYRGFDWPSVALLWANFFDPRFGLFVYCPALLLAFAAPWLTRVRYRVPRRETVVLLIYFGAFVLFCAANRYSWLQPSTGFRYLVPVVPVLALLAIQAAQALPRMIRWIVSIASCAQSLAIAVARQNDVRLVLSTLWRHEFLLPWMIRLGNIGMPVTWIWPAVMFSVLALAVTFIWCPLNLESDRGRPCLD